MSFVNQGVEPLDCHFGKGLWLQMAYLLSYQSASPMYPLRVIWGLSLGIYINVDTLFNRELWQMELDRLSSTRSVWALNKYRSIAFADTGMWTHLLPTWLHGERCVDSLWFILKKDAKGWHSVAFVEPALVMTVTQVMPFLSVICWEPALQFIFHPICSTFNLPQEHLTGGVRVLSVTLPAFQMALNPHLSLLPGFPRSQSWPFHTSPSFSKAGRILVTATFLPFLQALIHATSSPRSPNATWMWCITTVYRIWG